MQNWKAGGRELIPTSVDKPGLRAGGFVAIAMALACLLYATNLGDYFLHDSAWVLEQNRAIKISGQTLDEWRTAALSTDSGPLGRSVSMLSFAANHVLAGELDPVALKTTNIILHAVTGFFLWLFLSAVLRSSPALAFSREQARWVASLATALWLLHPLHVSTVLYAVQRMTQLAALFTFAGLWLVFRQRAQWLQSAPKAEDYSRLLLVGLLFTALATLSKENGLLLPLLAAVTELTLFRFSVAGGTSPLIRRSVFIALTGAALLLAGLPLVAPDTVQAWYTHRPFTLGERLLTQTRMLWHYLAWISLPDITAMGFHHDDIPISRGLLSPITTLLSIVGLVGLVAASAVLRHRWPLFAFAVFWFLCGHLLESSIFALEMSYEHRNYLPAVGPLLLFAALPWLVSDARAGLARLGLGLFLTALVPLLFLRGTAWTSELQLAQVSYRHHPDSVKSHFNLAASYFDAALVQEERSVAQQYFAYSRAAALGLLDKHPDYVPALVWLILIDSNSSDTSRVSEWQERLALTLAKPELHVSDIKFLGGLNNCIIIGKCPEPPGGQAALLRSIYDEHHQRRMLLYQLADFCRRTGQLDCARREAQRLLERDQESHTALQILYQLNLKSGQPGRALENARALMMIDERRRYVRGLLGAETGNPDGR